MSEELKVDGLSDGAVIAAARAWWEKRMPSHFKGARIGGDGRVTVFWCDEGEDGQYTLPVEFLSEFASAAHIERIEALNAELRELLQCLENANEQLAATRTREVYLAMIDSGQADALLALDNARRNARAALASATPTNASLGKEIG